MFDNFRSNHLVETVVTDCSALRDEVMNSPVGQWAGEHKVAAIGLGVVALAAAGYGLTRLACDEVGPLASRLAKFPEIGEQLGAAERLGGMPISSLAELKSLPEGTPVRWFNAGWGDNSPLSDMTNVYRLERSPLLGEKWLYEAVLPEARGSSGAPISSINFNLNRLWIANPEEVAGRITR